jgi:hypothetical protein
MPYILEWRDYKQEMFWYGIPYMVGYTKMTKSNKNCRCEIYIVRSTYLSFLCSPKHKLFEHVFQMTVGKLLATSKYLFQFF